MRNGTAMDPNPERRGTRAFMFNPETVELEPIPEEHAEDDDAPPNLEPEPDDPDADPV